MKEIRSETHNTVVITIEVLEDLSCVCLSLGMHKGFTRPYTPLVLDRRKVELLIKIYKGSSEHMLPPS